MAVLARVASALLAPQVALAEAGIPVRSIVGGELLDRTGTRAALAYLRLAVDRTSLDPADLAEVYRRPSRGLPQWIVKWFRPGDVAHRARSAWPTVSTMPRPAPR